MTTTTAATAAREAFAAISDALQRNAAAAAKAEKLGQPAEAVAAEVQGLQQQRVGLFARLLRTGRRPDAELIEVEGRIAAAQAGALTAGAMLQARSVVLAELAAESATLHAQAEAARRDLRAAVHAEAVNEINDAIAEFDRAAEALRVAHGRVCGLGRAHAMNTARLREDGIPAEARGSTTAPHAFVIALPGLGRALPGMMGSGARIDCGDVLHATVADALTRWNAL